MALSKGNRSIQIGTCAIPLALVVNSAYCICMDTTTAAIESLRTFAMEHGELQFAHLCTAALDGEEWAVERVGEALREIEWSTREVGLDRRLEIIRSTDTTRPDGAIARSIDL